MAFRVTCVALLLSSLSVAGCGTVANLARSRPEEGGTVPFGGVKRDVACLQQEATGEPVSRKHPKSDSDQYPRSALQVFCAADLPLTLVGDLVTLPYTVVYSFVNQPAPTPPVVLADLPVTQSITPPPVVPPMSPPTPPATRETAVGQPKGSP